jgi:hypothetical protein
MYAYVIAESLENTQLVCESNIFSYNLITKEF